MNGNKPEINRLVTLLETQYGRLQSFLALLDRERRAIQTLETTSLVQISEAKITLLEEIYRLEHERVDAVRPLATAWGLPPDAVTLRTITERTTTRESSLLAGLHGRLSTALAAIRDGTRLNGQLIARSLAFVVQGLEAWRGQSASASLYLAHGRLSSGPDQPAFVQRRG